MLLFFIFEINMYVYCIVVMYNIRYEILVKCLGRERERERVFFLCGFVFNVLLFNVSICIEFF